MPITQVRMASAKGRRVAVARLLVDELASPTLTGQFKAELVKVVHDYRPEILILDWSGVVSAGTDAFAVLLALQRRLAGWKGTVRLCGMSPLLTDSFTTCGLDAIFSLYADLESARQGKAPVPGLKGHSLIRSRPVGDAIVISFRVDKINEFQMAERLGRELREALAKHKARKIVFDFENMEYVISEVFNLLLQVANGAKKAGCPVVACKLSPFLQDIYATMRFDTVIPVSKTLDEALRN